MRRNKIIEEIENSQLKDVPDFSPGDTVSVQVRVKEGNRERLQAYEGVVIGVKSRGVNSSFVVRKISHGVGVERTFQTHSPLISGIEVHDVAMRQAKLYYLRERSGRWLVLKKKSARQPAEAVPVGGQARDKRIGQLSWPFSLLALRLSHIRGCAEWRSRKGV